MTSPEAEALRGKLAEMLVQLSGTEEHPLSVDDMRGLFGLFADMTAEPDEVTWTEVDAGGIPATWADMEATGETMTTNADHDALIHPPMLLAMAGMFLAGHDPKDPLVAPIHADFAGIAPLYIQVGGHETLLDDAKRVAAAAQRDGVDVTLEVFPEMQHVFQIGAGNVPESDDAIAKIGAFLRPRLGPEQALHEAIRSRDLSEVPLRIGVTKAYETFDPLHGGHFE